MARGKSKSHTRKQRGRHRALRLHRPRDLRRGNLTVAVSTNGTSPGLGARIREELGDLFGRECAAMVEILGSLRPRLKAKLTVAQRRQFVSAVFDSDIRLLLKKGRRAAARARAQEILEQNS